MPKINNLLKGKTIQINPSEIENYVAKIPNMSDANFKKLNKAYKNNRGCRCSFDDNELVGSGFASMAKKGAKAGAKAIKNNKQLSKLKDQAINQGLNYAVNQAGLDENTGALIKSLGSNIANRQFDQLAGSGFASMAKKGAKAIKNNKQLSKLKDQAINQGLNYAVNQAGLDENTGALVKSLGSNLANRQFDQFAGSGFASMAKKGAKAGAKAIKNNKQLSKLKDQAINQGLNYAVNQAGLDENTGALVKSLGSNLANRQFDQLAGGSMFNKKLGRNILKNSSKALKIGNKISNAMGYDDLDNMAIDFATQQTLGRIDPTLGNMASKQLNRLADKQIEKHGGNINPYLPKQLQGGSLSSLSSGRTHNYEVYDNLSNEVQVNHQAFNPDMYLDPMFDQLKLIRQQAQLGLSGSGFKVNM